MAALEDDVPPLEDMSGLLNQIHQMNPINTIPSGKLVDSSKYVGTTEVQNTRKVQLQKSNSDKQNKQTDKKTNSFGGMKKGFLFSSPQVKKNKETENAKTDSNNMPYIKKAETEEKLKIDEVQNAMKLNEGLLQNKDWVNDDLLKQIEGNDILYSKLSNPQFAAAIAEFQHNPQAAMMKYADNVEMQNFLKEFCGVMGNHFSSLADKSQPKDTQDVRIRPVLQETEIKETVIKSEDEQKLEEILNSDKVKDILMDEKVQNLFHILKNDPAAGQRVLKEADGDLKSKIKVLIDVGLLQIEQR